MHSGGMKLGFLFLPFPREIVDDNLKLTLGEYRLLGYLLRWSAKFGDSWPITQEQLLYGSRVNPKDKGCGISCPRILIDARKRLVNRGWITYSNGEYRIVVARESAVQSTPDDDPVSVQSTSVPVDKVHRKRCTKYTGNKILGSRLNPRENLDTGKNQNLPPDGGVDEGAELFLTPDPAPVDENKKKTSGDPRHGPVRSAIQQGHERKFGFTCQWDGREAKMLSTLLSSNPNWTADQIIAMVGNRFDSDGTPPDRPALWIPNIGRYGAGPINQFNKLDGGTNGNPARKRVRDNLKACAEVQEWINKRYADHATTDGTGGAARRDGEPGADKTLRHQIG